MLRRRIAVRGVVQGVGFRPFVHRLATALSLTGYVRNQTGRVLIEVEGAGGAVTLFGERLRLDAPPLASVTEVRCTDVPATGSATFTIEASASDDGHALPPPDTATCDACLRELADPADRRHRHPFITCTHCGPRLTITAALPYDRASTTMARFTMCPACTKEYEDPGDRRFHAQPIACPDCGPRLSLVPAGGSGRATAHGGDAVAAARRLLAAGRIVAVKGLGGYHLACDASNARAVQTLRARKARGAKPFAVMCADVAVAARIGVLGPAEHAALTSSRRPIVLVRRRPAAGHGLLADAVCPGTVHVGVMLPYTPVHQLLFGLPADRPGPRLLVMTSGNRSGEPLVTDDGEALTRLHGLADAWLAHDRPIQVPCDDSLLRLRPDGSEQVLRRSRGYAPRPLPLALPVRPALAVGGDLKNTVCLGAGHDAWFSPHIGDMGDVATLHVFERAERHLRQLTGITPDVIAFDRHPGYHATRWARRHGGGPRLCGVQHHHAHIASVMAEHGHDGATPVIGVAFDGTGYGDDGTIWGGEVLLADYTGFRRFAHLAPVPLPGGDAGVAHTRRMALAHLRGAGLPWDADLPCVAACSSTERSVLDRQVERRLACVATSSMGRLFDAVSSLVGVCHRAGYEAQAAVELETAAWDAWDDTEDAYAFGIATGSPPADGRGAPLLFDPAPVLGAIIADLRAGAPVAFLAARFHRAVATVVVEICRRARHATGIGTVALTGGVFANALVEGACTAWLASDGFRVLRHGEVPPGDGGLALGQLVVAAQRGPDG